MIARERAARCSRATSSCSTRRTTAARTCPTSRWSRRCSSTTPASADPVLRRLARPPRRHRRHHAGLDAAGLDARRRGGRADRQLPAGRAAAASARRRLRALLARGALSGAQRRAEHRRPARAGRRQREGRRRSCARWSRTSACDVVRAYMRTCRTTPRKRCAACIDALKDGAFELRDGQRRA